MKKYDIRFSPVFRRNIPHVHCHDHYAIVPAVQQQYVHRAGCVCNCAYQNINENPPSNYRPVVNNNTQADLEYSLLHNQRNA